MAEFVNHNGITAEGKKVITALEKAIAEAERNPAALNSLPGYVRSYAANVQMLGTMTQEQYLRDFPHAATLVLESVQQAETKKQQEAEAKQSKTALEKRFEKLERELADTRKQLEEATAAKPPVEPPADPPADEDDPADDDEAEDDDGDDADE